MSMIFYHVTHPDNLPSIYEMGLIPMNGPRSQQIDETSKRIYLFTDIQSMDTALSTWLGEAWEDDYDEDAPCCSLRIELPDDFPIIDEGTGYEVISYHPIPPEYISFFRDE